VGGGATRSPAVSADAGAGAGTGAAGAELLAALLLSSSSRSAACSRACRSLCSSSSFNLKENEDRSSGVNEEADSVMLSLFPFRIFCLPFMHHGRHEAQ